MVSDQEIASCVESLLRGTAAAAGAEGSGTASLAAVLQRAQAQLGVDLSHKAPYIRDQMDLFYGPRLQPQPPPPPKSQPQSQTTPLPPLPASAPAPAPSMVYSQSLPPQLQQQLQVPLEMQQQFAAMQPQYIFQTMPPQQLPPVVSGTTAAAAAVSAPPPVPAMAFYPPPPLAFRYANAAALGGVATGGTLSFQQPAPGVVGGMASPTAAAPPAASDNKESATKRKRGGPGGLNKICAISPELQAVVGDTAMSRTQIVKQLWAYIRQNNLQDPDDKRKIICNDELRIVFETDATDMFKMNKLLAKHITPLDPKDQPREAKKFKAPSPPPQQVPPPPQQMAPANQPYIVVSDALAKFIGVQGTVPQDDALKYLWDYIKANQLEDAPTASILCDSQLQELFGCDTIPASQLSELLAHHFIQRT